tara:strand:- start:163 stop:561 length:399 start_codon:yes stop_codon:yes gene_type:complete
MIFLFFSLAIAEPLSYTIKKGDPAPIDGRLFNDEAVVNLIASNEELQEQCQISLQYQGKTLAAQHALEMEYVKAELEIEKKKSETLIGLRDEEIQILQKQQSPYRTIGWFLAGFGIGTGASIATYYAAKNIQ